MKYGPSKGDRYIEGVGAVPSVKGQACGERSRAGSSQTVSTNLFDYTLDPIPLVLAGK